MKQSSQYYSLVIELRKRLLLILLFFVGGGLVGVFYYEKIILFFLQLLNLEGATIVFSSPFEYMNLALNCGFITGIVSTLPIFFLQLIGFLKPALTKKEFAIFKKYVPFSLIFFISGFAIGFWMIKYVGAISYQAARNLHVATFINISHILSITLLTSSLMGLAFQFPLVLTILIRLKIISRNWLTGKRPFAYIIAIIFASLMPPTDVLSLILLTIPLVFLFEGVLLFNRNYQ